MVSLFKVFEQKQKWLKEEYILWNKILIGSRCQVISHTLEINEGIHYISGTFVKIKFQTLQTSDAEIFSGSIT